MLIPGWISQTGLDPLIGRQESLGSCRWVSGDSNFRFPFRSSMSIAWGFFSCLLRSIGQSDHLQGGTSWSQPVSFSHNTMFSPLGDVLTTAEESSQPSHGDIVSWPLEEDAVGWEKWPLPVSMFSWQQSGVDRRMEMRQSVSGLPTSLQYTTNCH